MTCVDVTVVISSCVTKVVKEKKGRAGKLAFVHTAK